MELYLVRHGEAKSALEDPACPLTDPGAEAVRKMAAWAAVEGVRVDVIRHSGKKRAEQTAAILAGRLEPPGGSVAVPGLKPDDDAERVADDLALERGSVMLVGHLPFLARLTARLLAGKGVDIPRFVNAEIVRLSSRDGTWSLDWSMSPDRL